MNQRPLPKKILVYVGGELVGDGLMKLPFIRRLRSLFPKAEITWLAGQGPTVFKKLLAPLVADDLTHVVEGAPLGLSFIREFFRPSPLKGQHFDLVIDTQKALGTALLVRKIPHTVFISPALHYRLSDGHPPHKLPPKSPLKAQLDALLDAVAAAYHLDPTPLASFEVALPNEVRTEAERLLPHRSSCYIALAPGAGSRNKCWPRASYIALAKGLQAAGFEPVFLLGPQEQDWVAEFQKAVPDAHFPLQATAMKTPLLTIALGTRCAMAVANDSGVGHMLGASNVPLISLFGPTPAAKFAPNTQHQHAILEAKDFPPMVGEENVMARIPVDVVLSLIVKDSMIH